MLYISPIYLGTAIAVYAEFFEDTLHSARLGTLGHWLGRGVRSLGLKNPVGLKNIENIASGFSADGSHALVPDAGDPRRIAAYRVVMDAPARLNSLYGVSPREARIRIERGFAQGVNRTLQCLEDMVTGVPSLVPEPQSPKTAIAVFRNRAASDYSPELQATGLLMNVGIQAANTARAFSPSDVMGFESSLRNYYERALQARMHEQLSPMRTMASKVLRLDPLVEGVFQESHEFGHGFSH